MPLYEYACPNEMCDEYGEVVGIVKSMAEVSHEERCGSCGMEMERSYRDAPGASIKGGTPRFHRRSM